MSQQNVKVAVRIRPLTAQELLADARECVFNVPQEPVVVVGQALAFPSKTFTFDYVFNTSSTQELVYVNCVEPLLEKFLEGFNATIVAYGQTGSGKTFSMGTGLEVDNSIENQGLVPRVINALFSQIRRKSASNPTGFKSTTSVTFLELYNEDLIDLLNPKPGTSDLTIREDGQGNIVWSGVREEQVDEPEALLRCLQKGSLCRTTGSTDMNASSSRSHAIFTIILKQQVWTPSDYYENVLASMESFNPVNTPDLAGSERLKRTNAAGDRKKEGISINQGLLSLGNVISALGDDNRKSSYVPFRDSKLTRLLQDSLGGNSQTLMIACVSPSNTNYGETISTLQYANRARNIKNKVSINQIMSASSDGHEREVLHLRDLVSKLTAEIATLRSGKESSSPPKSDSVWAERQLQQQEALNRDLKTEIESLQKVVKGKDFEIEKLLFFQSRLYQRSRDLNKELSSVLAQRDSILLKNSTATLVPLEEIEDSESTLIPNPANNVASTAAFSNIPFNDLSRESTVEQNRDQVVQGYLNAISQLRFRLADTDDKLRWYKNVFENLGNSKTSGSTCVDLLHEMISTHPENKFVKNLVEENEADVDSKHERRLFRALRQDPELKKSPEIETRVIASTVSSSDEPPIDETSASSSFNHIRSTSLYILVDKIQSDISENEQIVSRLHQREAEYEAMKSIFEQKLSGLKVQLLQVQRERDLAIERIKSENLQPKEKAGTIAVKARFDKRYKQLESEISELRQKLALRTNSKAQSAALTKNLMATIQSLKAEKSVMTRKLKQEADKNRDLALAKERELERLRLRGRRSDEMLRKLEKGAVAKVWTRIILKRTAFMTRGPSDSTRIKNVFSIIKRSSSASVRRPDLSQKDVQTVPHCQLSSPIGGELCDPPEQPEELQSVPIDVRAHFKKQMLEKELEGCTRLKRVLFKLHELQEKRTRLLGEQRELLAERERCIDHDLSNGKTPKESYYMDERLEVIDFETSLINSRISEFEGEIKIIGGGEDDAFENAQNILKSLDPHEIQLVSCMLMKETVDLRVLDIEKDMKLSEKEKMLIELRAVLETHRAAALKTSMQFEKRITEIQDDAKRIVERAILNQSSESPILVPPRPRSVIGAIQSPLPQIPSAAEASPTWEQGDPAALAQTIVSTALSNSKSSDTRQQIRRSRKNLEELNTSLRNLRGVSDKQRPARPQSAPLLKITEKQLNDARQLPPRRTPSPDKMRTMRTNRLAPIHRSVSLTEEGGVSSAVVDDAKIWQEALNAIQKSSPDDETNVFERLASRHTFSTYLKRGKF